MFAFSANSYGVGGETKAPLRMFPRYMLRDKCVPTPALSNEG